MVSVRCPRSTLTTIKCFVRHQLSRSAKREAEHCAEKRFKSPTRHGSKLRWWRGRAVAGERFLGRGLVLC